MDTGKCNLMKKALDCALSVVHLDNIGLRGCHLVSGQLVKSFKKKNEAAFLGIPGVHIVADDIIIVMIPYMKEDYMCRVYPHRYIRNYIS